jgi:hypothetical protein
MKESTKARNIRYSNLVANEIKLNLEDKEYNYGNGIGKADNYCYQNGWLIVFEIEYGQSHPNTNVIKIWPYLDKTKNEKIFLIHVIVPHPDKKISPNRINLCDFAANKICANHPKRFKYHRITWSENKYDWLPGLLNDLEGVL